MGVGRADVKPKEVGAKIAPEPFFGMGIWRVPGR